MNLLSARPIKPSLGTLSSPADRAHAGAMWVTASTVITSAANYGFSLALIHLLTPADYVAYASVQSLLLILGSGGMAAIPWAVAHEVAVDPRTRTARRALSFGLVAATIQGLGFAAATYVILAPASGQRLAVSGASAAFAASIITAPLGLLQGRQEMARLALLRLIETVVRIGVALIFVVGVRADPALAVVGFATGSLTIMILAIVAVRDSLPLQRVHRDALRGLLSRSLRLGMVQLSLASLGVVDSVAVTFTSLTAEDAAAYQVAALLGRVPLYLGTAIAMSYFPILSRAQTTEEIRSGSSASMRLVVVLGIPVAVLVATCPPIVLRLLTGAQADQVADLLPATSLCGVAVAMTTVVLVTHQARGHFKQTSKVLLPIVVLQPIVLVAVGRAAPVLTFAACSAGAATVALAAAVLASATWRPWSALTGTDLARLATTVGFGVLATVTAWGWLGAAAAGLSCLLSAARTSRGTMT